jgi:hypothetical protein
VSADVTEREGRADNYDPVLLESAMFFLDRQLSQPGTVKAHVGDRVEPESELAIATVLASRPVLLNIAGELDIAPTSVPQHLSKPTGSLFEQGEVVARARRGLRSVTCVAPVTGTLSSLDESTGLATLTPESETIRLHAAVHGEVESIIDDRGALIRASGSRIRGVLVLGGDVFGPLKTVVDRPDRELTADAIDNELSGSIVIGGMTLGAAALRKLVDVGALGVIVGSISEGEVRRALAGGAPEPSPISVWRRRPRELDLGLLYRRNPFTVFITEGFGRRRMASPIFRFLIDRENQPVSILSPLDGDLLSARPDLYLTGAQSGGDQVIQRVSPRNGSVARLVDPEHLGVVVACRSGVMVDLSRDGLAREVVDVELTNRVRRRVPALNLEIIVP